MTATRASKRSAVKARRAPDGTPRTRTRSHTHRDQLCERLLTLDPAAITLAVKVLKSYDTERSSYQRLAQWDQLVVTLLGSHRTAEDKSGARSPATSRSNSSIVPAAFNTPSPFGWSITNNEQSASTTSGRVGLFTSAEEMKRFGENVLIVKGDIGTITELGGHKIDGIAFPAAWNLSNNDTDAAATVFRRAGDELTSYAQGVTAFSLAGTEHVTPGFGAGVDKLIHAIGPFVAAPFHYPHLEIKYRRVMEAAQREKLQCLALASISAGDDRISCNEGAHAAMRALQRVLARGKWLGILGIVCNGQEEFDAFTKEKQAIFEFSSPRSL